MNHLISIILLLFLSTVTFAQNQVRIDSLLTNLPTAKGTNKADIYNELSAEYHNNDPVKAIEFAEKGLVISQKKNYKKGTAQSLTYIGRSYRSQSKYTEALKHFFLALPFYESSEKMRLGYGLCLQDIGDVYKSREVYRQAMIYYHKAKDVFLELNAKKQYAYVLCNLAAVSYKFARFKRAQDLALEGLKISKETGTNEGIKEASLILSEVYANVGNYQQAYQYRILYANTKDSVYKVENALENKLISEKFEKQLKDQLADIEKKDQVAKNKRAKQRRDNIQYSLIILFFVGLFAAIFVTGKIDVPQHYIESLIFLTLLLVFRFILIILVSLTDSYTEGAPLLILFANVVLAILFMPLHQFLEKRLKNKVIDENSGEDKLKIAPVIKSILHRPKDEKDLEDNDDIDRDTTRAKVLDE